jgi:hypothetical protein
VRELRLAGLDRRSVMRGEPSHQRRCGGDAHLLPDHRPHRQLERIPCARHARPRPFAHERTQRAIAPEVFGDRVGIGEDVEQAAHAIDDRLQRVRERARHGQQQHAVLIVIAHADHAACFAERDRAAVLVVRHVLDALDRARPEKRE